MKYTSVYFHVSWEEGVFLFLTIELCLPQSDSIISPQAAASGCSDEAKDINAKNQLAYFLY